MRVIQTVIPRTVGELRDGGGAAPSPGAIYPAAVDVQPAHRWKMLRTARAAAAIAGLAVIGAYVGIALARLGYPGHLEILEGNSLVEMHRILAGQQLYPPPSAGYVPDGYTPLYFAVSAAAASVLGQSYLPLRLVSLVASLACFAILGRLVHARDAESRAQGWPPQACWPRPISPSTRGLTSAGLTRCSSLSASRACTPLGGRAAREGRSRRVCCSEPRSARSRPALVEGVAVLVRWRPGLAAGSPCRPRSAYAAVVGGSTLALGLASHGWYVYYVFEQMSQHALSPSNASQFWISELLPTLGIAICAAVLGAVECRSCCSPDVPRSRSSRLRRARKTAATSTTCCPPTW